MREAMPGNAATITGWSKQRVAGIATRYVASEPIGLAMVERMKRKSVRHLIDRV
jgi:hypothetical protein